MKSKHTLCLIATLLCLWSVCASGQKFQVHTDTIIIHSDKVLCDGFLFTYEQGYWNWVPEQGWPSILYQDATYTVTRGGYGRIWFTENEPSVYTESRFGCLQSEIIYRQYLHFGNIFQVLRWGDYYYLIDEQGVDSILVTARPGYMKVKNHLPSLYSDVTERESYPEAKWCVPKDNWAKWCVPEDRATQVHCRLGASRWKSYDTTYLGAFKAFDQLYYVITIKNETFIAQRRGQEIVTLLSLGKSWNDHNKYDIVYYPRNLEPDDQHCRIPFYVSSSMAGLLDIDGGNIAVHYIIRESL